MTHVEALLGELRAPASIAEGLDELGTANEGAHRHRAEPPGISGSSMSAAKSGGHPQSLLAAPRRPGDSKRTRNSPPSLMTRESWPAPLDDEDLRIAPELEAVGEDRATPDPPRHPRDGRRRAELS